MDDIRNRGSSGLSHSGTAAGGSKSFKRLQLMTEADDGIQFTVMQEASKRTLQLTNTKYFSQNILLKVRIKIAFRDPSYNNLYKMFQWPPIRQREINVFFVLFVTHPVVLFLYCEFMSLLRVIQCFLSISPGKIRKPEVFYVFGGEHCSEMS